MCSNNTLLTLRNEINNIDQKIVTLLAERKMLALKIAQSKIKNNQEIRDVEREKKLLKELNMISQKNNLSSNYITKLFRLIIEESVQNQRDFLNNFCKKNNITLSSFSFLGPKGSYSHIAACEYANRSFKTCIIKECSTFKEVVLSVEKNETDYAVLPIENRCSGFINEVIALLEKTNLFIVGEIYISVRHCLLTVNNTKLHQIKQIYSHPQPFQQCSNFIKKFPEWKIKYTKSTADAMKIVAQYNDITNAALGSEIGSKIYGLKILSRNLSNKEKNITRFILLNRKFIKISSKIKIKTTVIFIVKKKSEELSQILIILKESQLIISKITSQNTHKNLSSDTFYVDIQENYLSQLMQDTLQKIRQITNFVKVLGCYPTEDLF